jgi:hypothetical protein
MGLGRHPDPYQSDELIELRDHLSELASGYLERYGRDDIYYSLINTIENVTDTLGRQPSTTG